MPSPSHVVVCCTYFCFGITACFVSSSGSGNRPTSCDVETSQLKASFSAQASGPTTTFYAAVFSSGPVNLGCGDAFVVTSGAERIILARDPESTSSAIHYVASWPSTPEATTFTLALARGPEKRSAPASHLYLPATFTVLGASASVRVPSEAIRFRLDPPMAIDAQELTPSTVRLRVEVEGPYLDKQTYVWTPKVLFPPLVQADGNVVLDTKFFRRKGTDASCDAKLRISEVTSGDLDSTFGGPVSGSLDGIASFDVEGSRHAAELPLRIEW